jgi:hypothetical protein
MTVATVVTGSTVAAVAAGRRSVAATPQPPMGRRRNPGASTHGSHTGGPLRRRGLALTDSGLAGMRPK